MEIFLKNNAAAAVTEWNVVMVVVVMTVNDSGSLEKRGISPFF